MPDVSPWVEFGLAGLFGVFALILTKYFLDFLDKSNERWAERFDKLDTTIKGLDDTIKSLNNKGK
jgi:hypothetical protein